MIFSLIYLCMDMFYQQAEERAKQEEEQRRQRDEMRRRHEYDRQQMELAQQKRLAEERAAPRKGKGKGGASTAGAASNNKSSSKSPSPDPAISYSSKAGTLFNGKADDSQVWLFSCNRLIYYTKWHFVGHFDLILDCFFVTYTLIWFLTVSLSFHCNLLQDLQDK